MYSLPVTFNPMFSWNCLRASVKIWLASEFTSELINDALWEPFK